MYKAHLKYEVPYADTDQMGMVYYANYLIYFERGRTRLFEDLGIPYPQMEADGLGLPVLEAHVDYKAPAHYGEVLDIYTGCEHAKGAKVRICCEVYYDGRMLASGYTVHACIDIATGKPQRLPKHIVDGLIQ